MAIKSMKSPLASSTSPRTANSNHAAVFNPELNYYGIQFHPEVSHTPQGKVILQNFVHNICHCRNDWSMGSFVEEVIARIRAQVGKSTVIGAISGGVDSTVAALLMDRAIGDQFHGFFVDNGLLRLNEARQVMERLHDQLGINPPIDASDLFLEN